MLLWDFIPPSCFVLFHFSYPSFRVVGGKRNLKKKNIIIEVIFFLTIFHPFFMINQSVADFHEQKENQSPKKTGLGEENEIRKKK